MIANSRLRLRQSSLSIMLIMIMGCQGAKGPTTFPVEGTVTMADKPVVDAIVRFSPAGASADSNLVAGMAGAQAQTDAAGHYSISIVLDNGKTTKPGLPAGDYVITVQKLEFPGGGPSIVSPPKNTLPPKYASVQSTTLKATVKPEGENKFDFPL